MTMFKSARRVWRYMGTKLHVWHDEHADPKVQLEQAEEEARAQHRRLLDQAANVIGHQQQAQTRLDRTVVDYEKATGLARQALMLHDQASRSSDSDRAATFATAAEGYAAQLLVLEQQLAEQRQQVLEATDAAARAKSAVNQNAAAVGAMTGRKQQMLSQLEHAKMQEAANRAEERLSATLGEDVPTVAEVQRKIDARLARARGHAELLGSQAPFAVDPAMVEVEQAQRGAAAQLRLSALRAQLGLPAPGEARLELLSAEHSESVRREAN
jgi:phage shock protein A